MAASSGSSMRMRRRFSMPGTVPAFSGPGEGAIRLIRGGTPLRRGSVCRQGLGFEALAGQGLGLRRE